MTSVRTCYCKQEENAPRKKNDNCGLQKNGNQYPTAVVSRTSTVKNEKSGESSRRGGSLTDERVSSKSRSVEVQPSHPALSPETSIALENAEKIINNAKMQLAEVCAMSNCLNSLRSTINTYSDDPPLDDEAEELLYIRELVATKFQEASSSKSDAKGNQADSARSEKPARAGARQVDLSASKFRMSRRRADWKSNLLGYRDDDRSRERASPVEMPPRNDRSSTKEPTKEETTARDNRTADYRKRTSSAAETTCRIQTGPSVDIVADPTLTKQDLEDVHISPHPFLPQHRTNTATYTLRRDEKSAGTKTNETETSRVLKSSSVELDSSQQRKREELTSAELEAATKDPLIRPAKNAEDAAQIGNFNSDGIRIESSESYDDYGETRKTRNLGSQNGKGETITDREAMVSCASKESDISNEELRIRPKSERHVKVIASDDINDRGAEDEEIFNNKSDIDKRAAKRRPQNERDIADEQIQRENRGYRSGPSLESDSSRRMRFPRREDITSPRCRATKGRRFYRAIDEHLDNTFNSHNGQEEPRDVANKDTRRPLGYWTDFQWEDGSSDLIDLYRPRIDDLNSVLLSNDKTLRHVARATKTFAELLSRPEFAKFKTDEARRTSCKNRGPFADKDEYKPLLNRVASSSEVELKNVDPTVSSVSRSLPEANANDAQRTKSSDYPASNNDCTRNSLESSVYPESDRSEVPRILRDNNKVRTKASSSESSSDKSDTATFSNPGPALSSTRTQTCRHGEERIVRANRPIDAKLNATNVSETLSENRVDRTEHLDVSFVLRHLRDTSEATDRFVACILQDEKHSVEKKIRSVLKESAIIPAAIRELLNRLCESVRTTCRAETLNILKTISNDIQDDQKGNSEVGNDSRKKLSRNISVPAEHCYDFEDPDKRSSGMDENERNAEAASIPKPMGSEVKSRTYEKSIDKESRENRRKTSDEETSFSGNVVAHLVRANAVEEEPILQTQRAESTDASDDGKEQTSERIDDLKTNKYTRDSSGNRGGKTAESVRSESKDDKKSKGSSYSEAESLNQISDIQSDDDSARNFQNSKTVSEERKSGAGDPTEADANKERHKDKSSDVEDNKTSVREDGFADKNSIQTVTRAIATDISKETSVAAAKEAASEKEHSNGISAQKKISRGEISEASKKQLDSTSILGSKTVDKNPARKYASFPPSSTKEDTESVRARKKTDNNLQQSVVAKQTDDCSASSADLLSVRSNACVSSVKNKKLSLEEDPLRDKRTCFNIAGRNDSTENALPKDDEPKGDDGSKLLENVESSDRNGQTNTLQKNHVNELSSNSSVSSALFDLDDRPKNNDVFSAITKSVETSAETYHSEGELYMPSSCSYSLGEVRILKKSDLITDNTTDREESAMLLVTRSMLTSLNDSTMSLLGNSSRT